MSDAVDDLFAAFDGTAAAGGAALAEPVRKKQKTVAAVSAQESRRPTTKSNHSSAPGESNGALPGDNHEAPGSIGAGNAETEKREADKTFKVELSSGTAGGTGNGEDETVGGPTIAPSDGNMEVIIEKYDGEHNCVHECVRPKPTEEEAMAAATPKVDEDKPPARTFKYKLDPFQATAIKCLEKGESVLVSAHTSAGKTTVAEYAISMGLRDKQRVIYTSPIKALSNQKYRDLSAVHGDEVGLLTGDVTLNSSASVMIMTTEILRSMLYRGSELVREMKWVIFDEIHYMRDRDRGVVWEETIILLPDTVRLVFLSATIPNALQFAEWICRVKHQPCHVIYTDFRPVPLQHYLFPKAGEGVHLVMDEMKNFREENFHNALAELNKVSDELQTDTKRESKKKGDQTDIEKIIKMCHDRNYTPVIVFAFSKREVEGNAVSLKRIKLSTPEEEVLIEDVFKNAMSTLGDDKNLPQISCILPLLKRGIGIHHGGLLPIVKEVIEILFQESLLKVLFSTETFSMGINMPAKTVVFTKLMKFDGVHNRLLSAGEYIQMSGRAGRRGLDERGLSIIMFDEKLAPDQAKNLFLGDPLAIESTFHLGYNMLLNLMRVEGADPDYMIQRSFFQFQQDKEKLKMEKEKQDIEARLIEMADTASLIEIPEGIVPPAHVDLNKAISDYYGVRHDLDALTEELRTIIIRPAHVLRFLQAGRLVRLMDNEKNDWGIGVLVTQVSKRFKAVRRGATAAAAPTDAEPDFVFNALLECDPESSTGMSFGTQVTVPKPCPPAKVGHGRWEIVQCNIGQIKEVTKVVSKLPEQLNTVEGRQALAMILERIKNKLEGHFPTLDPVGEMKITEPRVFEVLSEIKAIEKPLLENPLHNHPLLEPLYAKFHEKIQLQTRKQELVNKLLSQEHLVMRDDLRAMRRVLRRLGYLDEKDVISLKGRAACEVSTVDELVMCELLFQNIFSDYENDYLVAMLSTMVFDEKADDLPPSDARLIEMLEQVKEAAARVGEVSAEAKLPISVKEYVDKFKPVMMEITLNWMRGAKFSELPIPEAVFEGSVVRSLRRLEELLRQLACAARSIGDRVLERRFTESITKIRRGIVFSASLYL